MSQIHFLSASCVFLSISMILRLVFSHNHFPQLAKCYGSICQIVMCQKHQLPVQLHVQQHHSQHSRLWCFMHWTVNTGFPFIEQKLKEAAVYLSQITVNHESLSTRLHSCVDSNAQWNTWLAHYRTKITLWWIQLIAGYTFSRAASQILMLCKKVQTS